MFVLAMIKTSKRKKQMTNKDNTSPFFYVRPDFRLAVRPSVFSPFCPLACRFPCSSFPLFIRSPIHPSAPLVHLFVYLSALVFRPFVRPSILSSD